MSKPLAGRVVAVTGGARGIGHAIAARLAANGAYVAVGDRDLDGARVTARELRGTVEGFDCDVTDSASFSAFLRAVEARWGPIDVLVNNAGVMWVGAFDEEPESATERQLAVNLHGVIRGVKLTAPAMRARGHGHIVTIASAAAKLSPAGEATYAATKHGVFGYLAGRATTGHRELGSAGMAASEAVPRGDPGDSISYPSTTPHRISVRSAVPPSRSPPSGERRIMRIFRVPEVRCVPLVHE